MLDIAFIKENEARVRDAIKNKGVDLDLEKLLHVYAERNVLQQQFESLRSERNRAAKEYGTRGTAEPEFRARMRRQKAEEKALQEKLRALEAEYTNLMLLVPNVYADDVPVGDGDDANVVVEEYGKPRVFGFKPKDHIQLGEELDIVDFKQGVKVSGFRGYFLKNEGVLLQLGILLLAVEELRKRDFTLLLPPTIIKGSALQGSGHFPFAAHEVYEIANPAQRAGDTKKEQLYLAGTSEPALLAYFAEKKLRAEDLPKKVAALTPCYRSEAGSYGKVNKGLYRLHEFWKVEQVVLAENSLEESERQFRELLHVPRALLTKLELPFRTVNVCTGDMGEGKYRMYDIETYMPSLGGFGETHSNSLLTDWQARRLNIRYTDADGKTQFVHTLNNTAIASPRILIAVLENHQQDDGTVKIPKALQKYVGKKILKPKQ